MTVKTRISEVDKAALERVMDLAQRVLDAAELELIANKVKAEGWVRGAEFAAYSVQCEILHLKVWQEPPCVCSEDDPDERDKDGQRLLQRMLAAGLSRYEPDPLAALAAK
jgi:hypothetical protein